MELKDFFTRFNSHNSGFCGICNTETKLTYDHVPPQSCGNHGLFKINTFPSTSKWQFSRNGLKFKTICSKCNNVLLGSLDSELAKFCKDVKTFLNGKKSNLSFPGNYVITINPKNIIKVIIGHLLASKMPPIYSNKITSGDYWTDLKDIFDGNNHPEYVICIGIHNYSTINIFPLLAIGQFGHMKSVKIFSALSFYPLSFVITNERTFAQRNNFIRLRSDLEKQEINLNQLKYLSQRYPVDSVSGNEAMLMSGIQNYIAERVSNLFF